MTAAQSFDHDGRSGNASGDALHSADTTDNASDGAHAANPFSATIPERTADHRVALRKHLQRFYGEVVGWGTKIVVAAASFPLLQAYAKYQSEACQAALRHSTSCRVILASQFIPTVVFLAILIGNFVYHVWQYHRWEVAMANAKEFADRESVAKGWTDVFSIYVRSKRRSYHVMTWGLLALVYALVGLVGDGVVLAHGAIVSISWINPIANIVIGGLLLLVAYVLGSAYLPGDVIVRHTLALLIYAISNITDPNLAKRQAAQEADEFVRANPWWFYSH